MNVNGKVILPQIFYMIKSTEINHLNTLTIDYNNKLDAYISIKYQTLLIFIFNKGKYLLKQCQTELWINRYFVLLARGILKVMLLQFIITNGLVIYILPCNVEVFFFQEM